MSTKIEWATDVWNPITGCPGPKVSPGCAHCYAERMATTRLRGRMGYDASDPFKVTYHHDRYEMFLRARTHKRIFVNSMGDLFHPDVDQHELDCVFAAMLANEITTGPSHDYMILTKRPDIMAEYFAPGPDVLLRRWGKAGNGWIHVGDGDEYFSEYAEAHTVPQSDHERYPNLLHKHLWPLPNVWLMATVCNQDEADRLIPILLEISAAVRGVSIEPMLGPVDLTRYLDMEETRYRGDDTSGFLDYEPLLHWVICGGETGPGARPMHPDWVRGLRDQCAAAGTPFFFKRWGELVTENQSPDEIILPGQSSIPHGWKGRKYEDSVYRVGKRRSGRLLDGVEWNELPGVSC